MDRCPPKDFSSLSLPLCRYCFMGQAFQFDKSLSKNATSLRCYRTVSARWAKFSPMSCFSLLYLSIFQSVHVKGVVLIFSFKFSVLYNTSSLRKSTDVFVEIPFLRGE